MKKTYNLAIRTPDDKVGQAHYTQKDMDFIFSQEQRTALLRGDIVTCGKTRYISVDVLIAKSKL